VAAYYRAAAVRERLVEYCGGEPPSALAIAGYGGTRRLTLPEGGPVPEQPWNALLMEGADLCRSLGDEKGTLLQLDLDYVNHDDAGEPYREPESCFGSIEPVYQAVRQLLAEHGIAVIAMMTGRGYHFTTRVPHATALHAALQSLGAGRPRERDPAAQAHEGAGRLLEFLAHEALRRVASATSLPVTLADLPAPQGGPFVCLDLSAYGDPLTERYARCAFSSNQKAGMTGLADERPFSINLPRTQGELGELLAAREDTGLAVRMAGRQHAWIPDTCEAPGLVESYERSALGRFHRDFDCGPEISPEAWPWTYDSLDTSTLPRCASLPLEEPNPALLRPAYLRSVALSLWAIGWHPKSVACLVRSRFERNYGWGDQWQRFAPALRAAFYVRLFCGAVVAGLDHPEAFTCRSQADRQLCEPDRCGVTQRALFNALSGRLWERA
jgi:hypothetical protein